MAGPIIIPGPADVQQVGLAHDPGIRADPNVFGAQIGQAMQDMAGTLGAIGARLHRERQGAEDDVAVQTDALEARKAAAQSFYELSPTAGNDPENFHKAVETDLTKRLGVLDKSYAAEGRRPSSRAMARIQANRREIITDYTIKGMEAGHNARVLKLATDTEKNAMTVATDVAENGDLDAATKALTELYGTAGKVLGPQQVDRLKTQVSREIGNSVKSYLEGYQDEALGLTDEAEKELAAQRADAMVDDAVENGYIDPSDGANLKRAWKENYAIKDIQLKPAPERKQLLGAATAQGDGGARKFLLAHLTSDKDASHVNKINAPLAEGLAGLIQSAPPEIRDGLKIFSGYRDEKRQAELYRAALLKYGSAKEARRWVAPPGKSQHNQGNAADLQWNGKRLDKAPKHVRDWVHANAEKHGLQFRLSNEPWHVEAMRGAGLSAKRGGGLAPVKAQDLLRTFEGYRDTAYLDGGSYRTGYGSDTVTRADGTIEKVTASTRITREDAERDLERRTPEFAASAATSVGTEAWAKLPGNAQAALVSVAYNYGSLPDSVVAAVKSGDVEAIAVAVENLPANKSRRKQEAAIIRGGGVDPEGGQPQGIYRYIPPDKRKILIEGADNEIRQELPARRAAIQQIEGDAISSYRLTGKYEGTEPTPEDYAVAFEEEGADRYDSYQAAKETAQTAWSFGSLSESGIKAKLAAEQAAIPAGPGAEEAIKNFTVMQGAAAQTMAARERPAEYVMQHYPAVQKAWEAYSPEQPETARTAIFQMVEAQRQLGIPADKIEAMPPQAVDQAALTFKDATKPVEVRADALVSMVMITPDPEQQRAIFNQLVKAGVPESAEVAIDAAARGDVAASRRLFAAAMVGEAKDAKGIPGAPAGTEKTNMNAALETAMFGDRTVGDAFYSLDMTNPQNIALAQRDMNLMQAEVAMLMAGGKSQSAAIGLALKDLFGDVERVEGTLTGGQAVLGFVDKNVPQEEILRALDLTMPRVTEAVEAQSAKSYANFAAITSEAGENNIVKAAHETEAKRVISEGQFRRVGTMAWGFFDPGQGLFVPGPDGQPLTFTDDELMNIVITSPPEEPKPEPDMFQAPAPPPDANFGGYQR